MEIADFRAASEFVIAGSSGAKEPVIATHT
jgi:hypothetical protein